MSGRRAVVGGVFEGLSSNCPGPEQVLRAPRLTQELRAIQPLELNLDDLRRLEPSQVIERLKQAEKEPEKRALIASAIFVGTAQACLKGSYWSPSYATAAAQVDCGHFARPVSCLHLMSKMPVSDALKVSGEKARIMCMHGRNPVDAALELSESPENRHVCIVRCTAMEVPRSQTRRYTNMFEDQLFLRTTYYEGFERLSEDVQASPNEVIGEGGLIYTSGVGIFRGSLNDGAPWVERPPQIDVIWLGLPAHPQIGEQELYASEQDRLLVASALDRAFAWAASHGADAVVLPPLGCGMGGCAHPRLQMAGLIHEAHQLHARHLPVVCVASDHPVHCDAAWWDDFAAGVINGRPIPPPLVHVPAIPLMSDKIMKKDANALLDKRRKQLGAWSAPGSRANKNSFI
eukprot:gb/GFBE01017540.1/.p1 GENE.gb/GFBE01017540.1/~~gb/GFBE01017540.1/.p1  ORF type:complete len:403 (+),score=74.17 gb/GFBE01017540.1/:1-1209(+)